MPAAVGKREGAALSQGGLLRWQARRAGSGRGQRDFYRDGGVELRSVGPVLVHWDEITRPKRGASISSSLPCPFKRTRGCYRGVETTASGYRWPAGARSGIMG